MNHSMTRACALALLLVAIAGCASTNDVSTTDTTTTETQTATTTTTTAEPAPMPDPAPAPAPAAPSNPLLAEWGGPYGGVPPFDRVRVADFKPALETAMAQALAEADRIANDPAPPTFENTIVAMERSGRVLDRVGTAYGIWSSNMSNEEFQEVEREMAPKLAEFGDKIVQNEGLFRRIEAIYNSPDKARLTPEQQRLVWLQYTNFVRAGARLRGEAKIVTG